MTLAEINDVRVLVENVPQDLIDAGLRNDQIQTDVELSLRKSSIVVDDSSRNLFYVQVGGLDDETALFYTVTVRLMQPMVPLSTLETWIESGECIGVGGLNLEIVQRYTSTTWNSSSLGLIGKKRDTIGTIRACIADLTNKFANDLLSAKQEKKRQMDEISREVRKLREPRQD